MLGLPDIAKGDFNRVLTRRRTNSSTQDVEIAVLPYDGPDLLDANGSKGGVFMIKCGKTWANSRIVIIVSLFVFILLAYIIGMFRLSWFIQNDTLWHIKAGEYMVKHKTILTRDIFSWTMPDVHWYSHEWLWEVIAYLLYENTGFTGLFWVSVVILALTLFIGFWILKDTIARFMFIINSVLGWAVYGYFVARPHVLASLLFTIVLFIVTRKRLRIVHLIVLGLVFLVWANIHASVVVGTFFVLLFVLFRYFDDKDYKKVLIPGAIAVIVPLINPHHIGVYTFFFRLTTARVITDNIAEWQSPNFHDSILLILVITWFVVFFATFKASMTSSDTRWWQNTILFMVGLAMFLSAIRNIVLAGLVLGLACSTPIKFKNLVIKDLDHESVSVYLLVLTVTLLLSMSIYSNHLKIVNEELILKQDWANPFKAVDFMTRHGYTERILNDYDLGAYLIFRNIKCSIDSRADMYYFVKPKFTEKYIGGLIMREDFEQVLTQLKPKYVWLNNRTPAVQYLKAKGYRALYHDQYTILFKVW